MNVLPILIGKVKLLACISHQGLFTDVYNFYNDIKKTNKKHDLQFKTADVLRWFALSFPTMKAPKNTKNK